VVNQHNFPGSEETLRDCQRPDYVVGDDPAGVADDVGVTLFKAENPGRVEAGIHTGDNGDPFPRRRGEVTFVKGLKAAAYRSLFATSSSMAPIMASSESLGQIIVGIL
jgi:hypothetical protein